MSRSPNVDDHDASGIVRTSAPTSGHERVTVSSVPISRESRVSVGSAVDVEAAWLDRLVVAACEMPVAEGETAIVQFMVRSLGEIFPECGVGACLVPPAPEIPSSTPEVSVPLRAPRKDDREPVEQQLFKYVPEGEAHRGVGMDPTRLFPGFAFERVLEVDEGSTLHLATDDPQLEDDDSPMMHVVRRAAGGEIARNVRKREAA